MTGIASHPSTLSTAIMIFSVSQSSQRQASSLYEDPLLKSRRVHSITASSSDKPILPTEIDCQGEEDHGRRQSCTTISCGSAIHVSAQLHQHSAVSALPAHYQRVGLNSNSSTSSGGQEEESSDTNVQSNSLTCQDPSSSYFSEPNIYSDPDLFSIPPAPLDLSTLHDTWEHIRACCNNTMNVRIHSTI